MSAHPTQPPAPRPVLRPAPLLALLACLALSACSEDPAPREQAFRIGFTAALTSDSQPVSADGSLLAAEQVNARGGLEVAGRRLPVRLMVRDNRNRLEETLVAVRELITRDQVSAVVGPFVSRQAIPAGALAQSSGVVLISPSSSNPETTRGKPFVFRVAFVDSFQGKALARFAREDLGAQRAAVLFDAADEYCRGVAEYFREAFTAQGGEVGAFEAYLTGDADFASRLARIKAARCQVLLLPNFAPDLTRQLGLARKMDVTKDILGSDCWDHPDNLREPAAQGAYFSTNFVLDRDVPETRAFVQAFSARFGRPPTMDEALSYDAMQLLFRAAQQAGAVQPQALRTALAGLGRHQGVSGVMRFNGTGDPERSVVIVRIQDGRPAFQKEIQPDG